LLREVFADRFDFCAMGRLSGRSVGRSAEACTEGWARVVEYYFIRRELPQFWPAFWQTLNRAAVIEYKEKLENAEQHGLEW